MYLSIYGSNFIYSKYVKEKKAAGSLLQLHLGLTMTQNIPKNAKDVDSGQEFESLIAPKLF